MKRCPSCREPKLSPGTVEVARAFTVKGRKHQVVVEGVPALVCGACGEALIDAAQLSQAEQIAAAGLIALGARSGKLLKWVRAGLKLTGADLAGLLDVTPETVSRWETERHEPGPAVWNTLADLVVDRVQGRTTTLDRLRARKTTARRRLVAQFVPAHTAA